MRPYFATTEQKTKTAIEFFSKNQFQAAVTIVNQIEKATSDPQIISRIKPLKNLAKAYDQWDKFQHKKAFQTIRQINMEELNGNKRFLGRLIHHAEKRDEPEPFYTADLINNAKRRGTDEKRYDDAVARLYRTIELIAQHKLRKKYGIATSQVKPEQIPGKLLEKWGIQPETGSIKLPLEKSYELLEEKGDELGIKYRDDPKLRDLLSRRNRSILAHNIEPVTEQTYRELLEKTLEYASATAKYLKELLRDSTFIKLKE